MRSTGGAPSAAPAPDAHRVPAGIIALDLDGTLLNSAKNLSQGNFAALKAAAEAGWEVVPTTGRFYGGMPDVIRQLPFVHYAITINGAAVMKVRGEDGEACMDTLCGAEMPWQQAVDIMGWLDDKPVIYDCYMDNAAWMPEALKEQVDEIIDDPKIRKMFHELRQPVSDLKAFVAEYCSSRPGMNVQKIQFFTRDMELRARLLTEIPKVFPGILATSSSPQNIELNQSDANKGQALLDLADRLGVPHDKTIAFGDGLNDITMIRAAGIGIAMENAEPAVKEAADWITASCDEDGVAAGVERFIWR
jgi:Cof subfamily protein (haloacid dehalogenase superfamily)